MKEEKSVKQQMKNDERTMNDETVCLLA